MIFYNRNIDNILSYWFFSEFSELSLTKFAILGYMSNENESYVVTYVIQFLASKFCSDAYHAFRMK